MAQCSRELAARRGGPTFVPQCPSRPGSDSNPTCRRGWTGCPGHGGTGASSSRSASRGCSTDSRSRSSERSDPCSCGPTRSDLSSTELGGTATAYLVGAVMGALLFGRLTDLFGRKRLFLVTLAVYLLATLASGLAWNFASFAFFRFFTGAGIGGEYSAVNSAVDELIPARVRGRADLAINSTYWLGTALGAGLTFVLLNPRFLPASLGWRCVFGVGAALGASVMLLRRHVPESPRWLLLHGRVPEAEAVTSAIEREVAQSRHAPLPAAGRRASLEAKGRVTFTAIARVLLRKNLRRTVLGLSLMIAQAFTYNGMFFTYAARAIEVLWGGGGAHFSLPLALRVFESARPMVLGHLFDRVGRRTMIALTYSLSGVLISGRRPGARARLARRRHADGRVVGCLLRGVGRGQLRLPDGQRALSGRAPRDGDRAVLRGRNGHRRRRRACAVRGAARDEQSRARCSSATPSAPS